MWSAQTYPVGWRERQQLFPLAWCLPSVVFNTHLWVKYPNGLYHLLLPGFLGDGGAGDARRLLWLRRHKDTCADSQPHCFLPHCHHSVLYQVLKQDFPESFAVLQLGSANGKHLQDNGRWEDRRSNSFLLLFCSGSPFGSSGDQGVGDGSGGDRCSSSL